MFLKLSKPVGMFYDPETKLRLVMDDVKEVPTRIGSLTREWLNAGGLVTVDSLPKVIVEEEPAFRVLPDSNEGGATSIPPVEITLPEAEEVVVVVEKNSVGRPQRDHLVEAETIDEAKALVKGNSIETLRAMAKKRGMKPRKTMSASAIAKNIAAYDKKNAEQS